MKTDKEILTDIKNIEELLNEMFKEKVAFTFSQDVVFHNYHIGQMICSLIEECTEFFVDYLKNTTEKRTKRRYEPIYWWYRFGIAKKCGFFSEKQIDDKNYVMMQSFKCDLRKQYFHKKRKRGNEGQKDFYEFSDKEKFKIPLLESIGLIWDKEEEKWNVYYPLLYQYYNEMMHTYVTPNYITADGFYLGKWVSKIIKNKNTLSKEKIKLLDAVEFPYRHLLISGTSFWEQALFYYIRQWYIDAKNRIKIDGYEFDIFIPGPSKIAIEYDGYYSHIKEEDYQKDLEKNQYCINNNIEIIRVREYGLKKTINAKTFYISSRKFTFEEFDTVAKDVLKYVCHTELLPIDTTEFRDEIVRQYCNLKCLPQYKNFRKIIDYYNQHLEWPTKTTNYELWRLMCQFRNAKNGRYVGLISKSWLDELERMSFPFDPYNERFEKFMAHLQRYYETNCGNVDINKMGDYVDYYDGTPYNLGAQLYKIKRRHPKNIAGHGTKLGRVLNKEQIERLESYGIEW